MKETLVQIGDVIKSEMFGCVSVLGRQVPIKKGKHGVMQVVEFIDETLADAEFVVEETKSKGGGIGHGPHDIYPNGWHVTARKLSKDGSYNPDGEVIKFYQSGAFSNKISEVEVVGKMEISKSFVRL